MFTDENEHRDEHVASCWLAQGRDYKGLRRLEARNEAKGTGVL